jgi:hypothetical protein
MNSKRRMRHAALGTACLVTLGLAGSAAAASGELTVYSRTSGRGDHRTFTSGERDLDRSGWSDRAASIRVDGGAWELCRETDYRECTVFAPGDFDLRDTRFEGHLRSIRPLQKPGGSSEERTYTRPEARYISNRLAATAPTRLDLAEPGVPEQGGGAQRRSPPRPDLRWPPRPAH